MRLISVTLLAVAAASPAAAHPHVFIDTAFDLIFDDAGLLTGVQVEWTYDELYSLLLVEENELDQDSDGIPEPQRLNAFAGGDVDWAAGFPGDFSVTVDGLDQALAPPADHSADWRDGRYVTTHVMTLSDPVSPDGKVVVARSYDPTYFVAYDVPTAPGVIGQTGCDLRRERADRAAAQAEYGDALAAVDMSSDPFEVVDLPDIGVMFADSFILSCDPDS
ncbi:DUF1007 family protein [Paracoccus albicereus]|nr:DUF1007 family protein [Paracoccus albicereus]